MRILTFVAAVAFGLWIATRILAGIEFEQNCEGYLKRAADASTIDLAAQNLAVAVEYARKNGLMSGYTSVVYRTPDEDVGYWFNNLQTALSELREVEPEAPKLERTNILMKLRETLLDQGETAKVTIPDGISVYPNNKDYAWWGALSGILLCVFWLIPRD